MDTAMTDNEALAKIKARAERTVSHWYMYDTHTVSVAHACLAALRLIDVARAHRDMEDAVAEFDRTVEGLK
jgi:hypothetical protein